MAQTNHPLHLKVKHTLELENRRRIITANVLAGLNYRDIAQGLGVSLGTVAKDVKVVAHRWKIENIKFVEDLIQIDLRRIDVAINAIWKDVQGGKLQAIDRMISLIKLRAELLGYDKKPLDVNLNIDNIDEIREKRWKSISHLLPGILQEDDEDNDTVEPTTSMQEEAG